MESSVRLGYAYAPTTHCQFHQQQDIVILARLRHDMIHPIFCYLGIAFSLAKEEAWLDTLQNYQTAFCHAVGSPSALAEVAQRLGARCLKGATASRRLLLKQPQ